MGRDKGPGDLVADDGKVTAKTRVSRSKLQRLERLARRNFRSVAAELRLAIDAHLVANDSSGKDVGNGS